MDDRALYVDAKTAPLSVKGFISPIALYVHLQQHFYLIDVHTLKSSIFDIAALDEATFHSILESPAITKAFFEIHRDAAVLCSHFGVLRAVGAG